MVEIDYSAIDLGRIGMQYLSTLNDEFVSVHNVDLTDKTAGERLRADGVPIDAAYDGLVTALNHLQLGIV